MPASNKPRSAKNHAPQCSHSFHGRHPPAQPTCPECGKKEWRAHNRSRKWIRTLAEELKLARKIRGNRQ